MSEQCISLKCKNIQLEIVEKILQLEASGLNC